MKLPAKNFKFKISNFKFGKRGFTLIEILVVITIIGILASFVTVYYVQTQAKARDTKRKNDLKKVQQALDLYFQTNGYYPMSFAGVLRCNIQNPPGTLIDVSLHIWGQKFACKDKNAPSTTVTYMNPLPADPNMDLVSFTPRYMYVTSGTYPSTYRIDAILENSNDPDYCDSSGAGCVKLPCQPAAGYNYCVIPQ